MIEYVFRIDGKPRIKYPIAKWTKYRAYKDCKHSDNTSNNLIQLQDELNDLQIQKLLIECELKSSNGLQLLDKHSYV